MRQRQLVVITPVYEDRQSATELLTRLAKTLEPRPFVVVVEDGSSIDPMRIADLSTAGIDGQILFLARNMGHQRAIAVGLLYAATHLDPTAAIVMDSDGEDQPEAISPLLERLETGTAEIVVARRRKRSETLKFRVFYNVYRWMFAILTGRQIRFGNFTALSRKAVKRLSVSQEVWIHFAASLITSRLPIAAVDTDRGNRYFGQSKMNFVSLALHGLRSMMVFSDDVLVRVTLFCTTLAGVIVVAFGSLTVMKLAGLAIPGWFSVTSGLLVSILLQAGVLTFVTLMISGISRNTPPITRSYLDTMIDHIESHPSGQAEWSRSDMPRSP